MGHSPRTHTCKKTSSRVLTTIVFIHRLHQRVEPGVEQNVHPRCRWGGLQSAAAGGHQGRPAPFLPTERCPGCLSCFARVLDLLAKELLEVLGQHTWRTSFDNLADLGSEANAAEAR